MADLPQPYFDPSQYPAYLDAQRKQQMAQMLIGSMQQSNQTPADWDSMKVVPKRGMLQNVGVLAQALMARKGLDASNAATSNYMQGLYGGGQPAAPQPTGPGAGIVSPTAPPDAQAAAQGVTNMPPGVPGLLPPQQSQNPLIPPGLGRGQAQALAAFAGPEEYFKSLVAPQFAVTEMEKNLRAAGIDPNSAQGRAYQQSILAKQQRDYEAVRGGNTVFDKSTGKPVFTGPENGVSTTWENGQPKQTLIPGATAAEQAVAHAKTTGAQTAMPIKLGVDEDGKDIYGYAAPAGSGTINATTPGRTASPGSVQSQKSGAEAGQNYATELSKNATGATEVRRSLSEMRNLAAQSTPGAANESKMKLGAVLIAAGLDPSSASKMLGVDPGVLQAAAKQNATLAVNSIHAMTSRGTNFDLDTFVRNNPNLNMADPGAFNRVVDYMDNKSQQEIAKQRDFAQWKKGVPAEEWETGHTSHWLETQNQAIDKGQSNSRIPPPKFEDLQAEARRRGLIK